ncbi:cytochrome c family protein [Erythrobacter sp. LQ02-29]|uniref:c-type cytochrome n=1 Tax=Erythrobacter sp. LQ02-29 TaxID=2920384 RepID=UPI001F4DDDA6|nr:cytochrome c family protein [Erythrobacter sp. LQ02-29]MCP9221630.1 cytochrome c family protein [Erythrobacter sp. LQ02-29]
MNDNRNTIFGWVLFSGVVALGLSSISSRVFHSEEPEKEGYFVEGVADDAGAEEGPSLATLLAQGDATKGEAIFAKCAACHTIAQGGPNGIGPNLYHVVGEKIGEGRGGFAFSSDLSGHGGTWTYENLDAWLKSPRAFASGTKMSFAGLGKAEDRANVILYLRENGGGPPLPTPEATEPAEGAAEGVDGASEGPGVVEGEPLQPDSAVDAMGDEQPVASDNAAPSN